MGSVQYVLQIEPKNRWFQNAKQILLNYAREYFRDEGSEEYYLHVSVLPGSPHSQQSGNKSLLTP